MKKRALLLCAYILLILSPAADGYFYIRDQQGQQIIFGTGSITFPNISGTAENLDILPFDDTGTNAITGWTSEKIQTNLTDIYDTYDPHLLDTSIHFTENSIDHENILNIGTYTHGQIDTHIDTASIHFVEGDIDHTNILNIGTLSHAALDAHVADTDTHFEQSEIDHNNLINKGSYSHASIDAHLDNLQVHHLIFDNNTSVSADTLWSGEQTKTYVDTHGGGGVSLSVTDNTETVNGVDKITFDPTGFSVTDDSYGDVTVVNLGGSGSSVNVLDTDTTCYVSTSGNDTTGDGTSGTPYATPQKCLEVYAGYKINSDVYLTIQFADGTYNLTSTIEITHPNADRIKIVGENTYTISLSSIQSSSGSAGAYSIILNVNDVSNIMTNDYVIIKASSGGTNPTYVEGCWPVTNVDTGNSRITISSTHKKGVPSGAVSATIIVLKSHLDFSGSPSGTNGLEIGDNKSIGIIDNLVILPKFDGWGIYGFTGANVNVGNSFGMYGGEWGINLQSARMKGEGFAISGQDSYGIVLGLGSTAEIDQFVVSGSVFGLVITHASSIGCYNVLTTISGHSSYGIYLGYNSTARLVASITGNGTGISASNGSIVSAASSFFSGNTSDSSPAKNTEGNTLSYITW